VVLIIGRNGINTSVTLGPNMALERRFAMGNFTCWVYRDGTLLMNGTLHLAKTDADSFSVQIGPVDTVIPNVINTYPNPIVEIATFGALLALVLGAIDLTARAIGMRRKKAPPRSRGPPFQH